MIPSVHLVGLKLFATANSTSSPLFVNFLLLYVCQHPWYQFKHASIRKNTKLSLVHTQTNKEDAHTPKLVYEPATIGNSSHWFCTRLPTVGLSRTVDSIVLFCFQVPRLNVYTYLK